jgi:hypothetical protein
MLSTQIGNQRCKSPPHASAFNKINGKISRTYKFHILTCNIPKIYNLHPATGISIPH